jgi:hypothetical protein
MIRNDDSYSEFMIIDDYNNYRDDNDYEFEEEEEEIEEYFEEEFVGYQLEEEKNQRSYKDTENHFNLDDIQESIFEEKQYFTLGKKNEAHNKNFVSVRASLYFLFVLAVY